jgi:hypothetical protein
VRDFATNLRPNKYVNNWLFVEHLMGIRYFDIIAYPLILILFSIIIVIKNVLSEEQIYDIISLTNVREKIIYPWDIMIVLFISWFNLARDCDRMFLFPTGKLIRIFMWTILPTLSYMTIKPLVLIILFSPLFSKIIKAIRPRTVIKVVGLSDMREDLNRIRDGRIEQSGVWAENFQLEDMHALDRKAWSVVVEDYSELRELLLKAKKQGCPVPPDILEGKIATNPDTDPTTYKAVVIYQDLRRALGYA